MKTYKSTKIGLFVFLLLLLAMIGLGFLNGSPLNQIVIGSLVPIIIIFILWLFLDKFSYIKIFEDGEFEVKNFSSILKRGRISDITKIDRNNIYKSIPLFGKTLVLHLQNSKSKYLISINQNLYSDADISDFLSVVQSKNNNIKIDL